MKRFTSHFPLIILALLAIATFWLEQIVRNEQSGKLGNTRHDPDSIVEQFAIKHFDNTGSLQSELTATKLVHFPDDDTADITTPVITLTRNDRSTVFTSLSAQASNLTKIVVLRGQVRGERQATPTEPAQILTTEELTVLTDDEIARTHLPVLFTQGNARMDGIGAEWDNINGLFTIHNQVRAFLPHAPAKAPQN